MAQTLDIVSRITERSSTLRLAGGATAQAEPDETNFTHF